MTVKEQIIKDTGISNRDYNIINTIVHSHYPCNFTSLEHVLLKTFHKDITFTHYTVLGLLVGKFISKVNHERYLDQLLKLKYN